MSEGTPTKKKKKDDLILWDWTGLPFAVAAVAYQFPAADAEARMPVEGLEEDGEMGTPAGVARRMLVAALREQARRVAIMATRVPLSAVTGKLPHEIVRLVGDAMPPMAAVMPVDMKWAEEFNRVTGLKIPVEQLRDLMDAATQTAVSDARTVTELLNLPAFSAARATMIIRTETAKAAMMARLEAMTGVKKKWVVSPGACPSCMAQDGVILPLHVLFNTTAAFGDVLTPPAHPNCRCSIIEVKQ